MSSAEGQQQLIALAKPYIAAAPEAMPDTLTKVLSDLVGIPVWRLGQIMGIRVSSTYQKNKPQEEAAPTLKATSIVLRLLAVLMRRPGWANVFSEELVAALAQSEKAENRFLPNRYEYWHNRIILWKLWWLGCQSQNAKKVLHQLNGMVFADDDAFLKAEFEAITVQLATELQSGNRKAPEADDAEAIREWYQQQKQQKTGKS